LLDERCGDRAELLVGERGKAGADGKRISPRTAQALLRRGMSPVLKGFKSKSGRAFDARLKLEQGEVRFDFGS
jgi:hypothetical protein